MADVINFAWEEPGASGRGTIRPGKPRNDAITMRLSFDSRWKGTHITLTTEDARRLGYWLYRLVQGQDPR